MQKSKPQIKQTELRNNGFFPIDQVKELNRYWVSRDGVIYDWERHKYIQGKRHLLYEGVNYQIGKLVLCTFGKWVYSSRAQIGHKDGNKKNNALENVYVVRQAENQLVKIDFERLMLAFRYYLPLPIDYKMNDALLRRLNISLIVQQTNYLNQKIDAPNIGVFEEYVTCCWVNEKSIFKKFGLSPLSGKRVLNSFINDLVNTIIPKSGINETLLHPFQLSKREQAKAQRERDKQALSNYKVYLASSSNKE